METLGCCREVQLSPRPGSDEIVFPNPMDSRSSSKAQGALPGSDNRKMKRHVSGSTARIALAATLAAAVVGCSGDGGSGSSVEPAGGGVPDAEPGTGAASGTGRTLSQAEIARQVFSPAVTGFSVHAFHEAGAEPYVGRLGLTANDTWDITTESYRDLFAAHAGRTLSVPSTLEQMQGFPDRGIRSWNIEELTALGDALAPPLVAGDEVHVTILFVNGLFDSNEAILGIHPANRHYAFVFKDVVESVGGDATTQRYVEQATIVHEIGHAIGLVANGVPMVNAHEDTDHPHHTTNRDGVMYWAVESRNGALAFLTDVITGARLSLFGTESLLDAQNFMPGD